MPNNFSILFATVSHTTHISHTLHPLHYGDYSPWSKSCIGGSRCHSCCYNSHYMIHKSRIQKWVWPIYRCHWWGYIISPLSVWYLGHWYICLMGQRIISKSPWLAPFRVHWCCRYMRGGVCQGILVWITFIIKTLITSPNWGWISPGSLPCSHHPEIHFKIIELFLSPE